MPFGEYELSPSLIGLSPPHSPHPEAFQRLSVRASITCYRDFTLGKCRSLGFASAAHDYVRPVQARFRCGCASRDAYPRRARQLVGSLCKRHAVTSNGCSDRLWAHGFRISFTPLMGVLFTFPSRYLFAIGLTGVFSLAGWARRIQTGFLVSRPTQGYAAPRHPARTGLSPSTARLSCRLRSGVWCGVAALLPRDGLATDAVWAVPRSLATTGGITCCFLFLRVLRCFSSPR